MSVDQLLISGSNSSVIKRRVSGRKLLTPGSIPIWQCVVASLGKAFNLGLFPFGPSSQPVMVAQRDERPANRTQKSALRWCG